MTAARREDIQKRFMSPFLEVEQAVLLPAIEKPDLAGYPYSAIPPFDGERPSCCDQSVQTRSYQRGFPVHDRAPLRGRVPTPDVVQFIAL